MYTLNPAQQAAVAYHQGPLLVLAGAGSGKTGVIIEKITDGIRNHGYPPEQIYAITFTQKAAQEMRNRLQSRLGSTAAQAIRISTFHRLGLSILEKHWALTGRQKGFSILDQTDSVALISDLLSTQGDTTDPQTVRHCISLWKNQGYTPDAIPPQSAAEQLPTIPPHQISTAKRLYRLYESLLQTYNAFDFDDLLAIPAQILRNHSEVQTQWNARIQYLLIDEYQDTNPIQYELFRHLVGPPQTARFTAVGDDDQAIYGFRGSNPRNIAQLNADFPNLHVIKLEQNYRSTRHILQLANGLIAHNDHVFDKTLWSDRPMGAKVRMHAFRDPAAEAEGIVQDLIHRTQSEGAAFGDFAILYRSKHQAFPLEEALRMAQIPYMTHGHVAFFHKPEVRDIMAYLRLWANPDDDPAYLRIINTPKRGIGHQTLETLADYARIRELHLYHASQELGLKTRLSPPAYEKLYAFYETMAVLDPVLQALYRAEIPFEAAIDQLLKTVDYDRHLASESRSPYALKKKYEGIQELIRWLSRIWEKLPATDRNLNRVLQRIALSDWLDRQSENDTPNQVQLMTLHAAKGLEFPHVYLIGFEEEILPHKNSLISAEGLDEERRLAYVGMTRAQKTLQISWAENRMQYGVLSPVETSRFLAELPADHWEWAPSESTPSVARPKSPPSASHWDRIQAMLKANPSGSASG